VNSEFTPTSRPERALLPDVLRGVALLGILMINIEGFVGPLASTLNGFDQALTGADRWVDAATYILVQGKFYALFSLLFGAGFAMILQRAAARGVRGGWLYLRRLLVLLAIGLVHALYIWPGDILTTYALVGIVLLLFFRRTPLSRLPKWATAIFVLPLLVFLLLGLAIEAAQHDPDMAAELAGHMEQSSAEMKAWEQQQRAAYGQGGLAEANAQRRVDFGKMMSFLPFYGPTILAMFLLGAWLMRKGALMRPEEHLPVFRWLRLWGFAVGLPLALFSFWLLPSPDFSRIDLAATIAMSSMSIANVLLCMAYLSTVALLLRVPRWTARLRVLAPAGRMALTNYLLQSMVCVTIFYGYGLGYFEQLPRAGQAPFSVALFAAQVAVSRWWLERFRFGPAEWLWRSLSYMRLQPMRSEARGE
jgi:uncharacterized protein